MRPSPAPLAARSPARPPASPALPPFPSPAHPAPRHGPPTFARMLVLSQRRFQARRPPPFAPRGIAPPGAA